MFELINNNAVFLRYVKGSIYSGADYQQVLLSKASTKIFFCV